MTTQFPSLPDDARLADVFRRFPRTIRPLLEFHDLLLRSDSDLSVGERELIAAYVSSLNACRFCFNGHEVFARAHGIAPEVIAAMLEDLDSAAVDPRLRPLLSYMRKLTETPAKMVAADAEAVYAAGWSEAALFDAVQTCALFNFMNRIVEGTGLKPAPESDAADGDRALPRMDSYLAFGRSLGVA